MLTQEFDALLQDGADAREAAGIDQRTVDAITKDSRMKFAVSIQQANMLMYRAYCSKVRAWPLAARWAAFCASQDRVCVSAVRSAAQALGYSNMPCVSGAGHDAVYVARLAPAGMVFVPCKDGISHNEIEDAKAEHLEAGCNVLMHAMLDRAGVSVTG